MMNKRRLEHLTIEELIPRAEFLIEALPYIQEFRGQTIVVKYGGSAQVDSELRERTAKDLALMELVGMKVVVVHGGGPEVSATMKKQGLEVEEGAMSPASSLIQFRNIAIKRL